MKMKKRIKIMSHIDLNQGKRDDQIKDSEFILLIAYFVGLIGVIVWAISGMIKFLL